MNNIDIFFNPRSIAVIGASENPRKGGSIVIRNLLNFGFEGKIYPVNPKVGSMGGKILGIKAYDSILSIPKAPELSMIVIPRDFVPKAVAECGEAGVKGIIISTAGFSDSGEEMGFSLEAQIKESIEKYDLRIMGPNSIGTINVKDSFVTSITTLDKPKTMGTVSFFGQTGMFASGFIRWITSSQNFSIAKVACLGNKADIDECDILEYLGRDTETNVVGIYFEGVKNGKRFIETARKVAKDKPVVVLKSGRTESGARAISSHTGTLAGDDKIYDGVFRASGLIRVDDFDHFYDALKTFSYVPQPLGNRVGVVSITGVGCVLTADYAGACGLIIPPLSDSLKDEMRTVFPDWASVGNPVDMWFAIEKVGPKKAYEELTKALARDDNLDIIFVIFTLIPESDFDAALVMAKIKDENPKKVFMACFMGGELSMYREWYSAFEKRGIPVFPDPGRMVKAAAAIYRYAQYKRQI